MKTIAIIAIAAALGALVYTTYNTQSDNDLMFEQFIAEHGRNFASQSEYNMRREIFNKNLKTVTDHNAKGMTSTMGVNQFSDWTDEEYGKLLGLKNSQGQNSNLPLLNVEATNGDKDIDWRDVTGYVGPIKNQGKCGSCWAFSATQAAEAAYFKKFGETVLLSESQLVDCDWFSHGCNGGLQENAFIHYMRTGPISDAHYPYVAEDRKCQESVEGQTGGIDADYPVLATAFRVDVGDSLLYDALVHQPVAISIRAENDEFRHYTGGIIDGDGCGTYIDHAVLLVGYNVAENYWIVKNSWGPTWGEEGYVRVARRGGMGICGINQQNSIPIWEDDF
jgi:C1A family cysteine protease